jgi:hypothetical protein
MTVLEIWRQALTFGTKENCPPGFGHPFNNEKDNGDI